MIKTIAASLFFASTFAQAPPVVIPPLATEPAVVPPVVPPVSTQPVPPVNPNTPYVPITTKGAATTANSNPAVPTQSTLPLLPPGEYYGAYGQICAPDPLRDVVCKTAGEAATEQYPGFMKCERGYDCCLCGSVKCGDGWTGCNTFSAGDSGIKGVKDVTIIGRSSQLGGGDINCIGIEGCAESRIVGRNIKSIDAAGILSMANAVVSVYNPVADFNLDCVGMGGCKGLQMEVVIEGPPPGYQCNPAIDPQMVEFNAIQCSGQESCEDMVLTIRNNGCNPIEIQQIECILPSSCRNTRINLIGNIEVNNCDIRGAVPIGLEQHCSGMGGNQIGGQWGGYNPYWVPV